MGDHNQDTDLGYSCVNINSPGTTGRTEAFPGLAVTLPQLSVMTISGMTHATAVPFNGPDDHSFVFHGRIERPRPLPLPKHPSTPIAIPPSQNPAATANYEIKLTAYLQSLLGHIDRQRSDIKFYTKGNEGEDDEDPAAGVAVLREETERTRQIRARRQMRASGG